MSRQKLTGCAKYAAVTINYGSAAVLCDNGSVYGWGDNGGQKMVPMQRYTYDTIEYPAYLPAMVGVVDISIGYENILTLTSNGQVWVQGWNYWNFCAIQREESTGSINSYSTGYRFTGLTVK